MLGKKHSEETKAKMSAIKKGQTHSEEAKAKISAGNKGKTYSNETIYKISVSKKGENHPMFGKTHSLYFFDVFFLELYSILYRA
jgi:hypothetical protein